MQRQIWRTYLQVAAN